MSKNFVDKDSSKRRRADKGVRRTYTALATHGASTLVGYFRKESVPRELRERYSKVAGAPGIYVFLAHGVPGGKEAVYTIFKILNTRQAHLLAYNLAVDTDIPVLVCCSHYGLRFHEEEGSAAARQVFSITPILPPEHSFWATTRFEEILVGDDTRSPEQRFEDGAAFVG